MNVAIINLKFITKNLVRIIIMVCIIIFATRFFLYIVDNINMDNLANRIPLSKCINMYTSILASNEKTKYKYNMKKLIAFELPILENSVLLNEEFQIKNIKENKEETTIAIENDIIIPKVVNTENVSDKNLNENYNLSSRHSKNKKSE